MILSKHAYPVCWIPTLELFAGNGFGLLRSSGIACRALDDFEVLELLIPTFQSFGCGLFGKIKNHLGRCVWESSNERISVFPWHVRSRLDVGLESEFVARKNDGRVRFGKTKKKRQELPALWIFSAPCLVVPWLG